MNIEYNSVCENGDRPPAETLYRPSETYSLELWKKTGGQWVLSEWEGNAATYGSVHESWEEGHLELLKQAKRYEMRVVA